MQKQDFLQIKSSDNLDVSTWIGDGTMTEHHIEATSSVIAVLTKPESHIPSRLRVFDQNSFSDLAKSCATLEANIKSCGIEAQNILEIRVLSRDPILIRSIENNITKINLKVGKSVNIPSGDFLIQFVSDVGRIRAPKSSNSQVAPQVHPRQRRIKVLIVDDSETIRKILSKVFDQDPELECVGTIGNPLDLEKEYNRLKPDVVTLDIHMPQMDGITLLKKFLPKHPIPVVMISSFSKEDGTYVLDALESGAVDYIQKPAFSESKEVYSAICDKIKIAGRSKVLMGRSKSGSQSVSHSKLSSPHIQTFNTEDVDFNTLIAIGASTGGTEALREVLCSLPSSIPPIVIVQHIPPIFSKAFADRLAGMCPFQVKEAEDGDVVIHNRVLIAPGGKQMRVVSTQGSLKISIDDSEPVNRHKPSVDVLFDSVVKLNHKKVVAALLTGMGADGAKGLLHLKDKGAWTIAQDEASCVVFGMPREAILMGGVSEVLPLNDISIHLMRRCLNKK